MPIRNQEAADFIAALGGASAVAEALGWPVTTVQFWAQSKYGIPKWRRPALTALAKRRDVKPPEAWG